MLGLSNLTSHCVGGHTVDLTTLKSHRSNSYNIITAP